MKRHNDILIVKNFQTQEFIPLSQVIFCERYKGATKIHMVNPSSFIADVQIEKIMDLINDDSFVEINESQILNTSYLKKKDSKFVTTILEHKFPVTKLIY